MKRVRMTFRPKGTEVHPVYDLLTGGADYLEDVQLINWQVSSDPAGFLIHARGDAEQMAADLDSISEVCHQEFIHLNGEEFYVYHTCRRNPMTDEIFDVFSETSLLIAFPMEYDDNGGATATIVGPEADIHGVIEDIPPEIEVEIEAVGGPEVQDSGVLSKLSDRQFEALEVGIASGYYDVPRQATSEDVARQMGCQPSTASEHLRKAETKLVTALLDHTKAKL